MVSVRQQSRRLLVPGTWRRVRSLRHANRDILRVEHDHDQHDALPIRSMQQHDQHDHYQHDASAMLDQEVPVPLEFIAGGLGPGSGSMPARVSVLWPASRGWHGRLRAGVGPVHRHDHDHDQYDQHDHQHDHDLHPLHDRPARRMLPDVRRHHAALVDLRQPLLLDLFL